MTQKKQHLHLFKSVKHYFCIFLFALIALVANAEVLYGTVVVVSDGDTITVLDKSSKEHKIRLMAIDAPEKSQAFGMEAKKTLSNYIYKKEVSVEYKKYDKYKRIVGKVTLGEEDICLHMIREGMAWHYTEYEKEQSNADRELYREAEVKARDLIVGLWHQADALKPSKFRSSHK